jgi:hypothetical protein
VSAIFLSFNMQIRNEKYHYSWLAALKPPRPKYPLLAFVPYRQGNRNLNLLRLSNLRQSS